MSLIRSILAKRPAQSASTKMLGDQAETLALQFLLQRGLHLIVKNFKTPGRGGGEIDLIMRAADGTLVFVEVRQRKSASHGGAAASISTSKQRRIVFAARHYLARLAHTPPCRFDVVSLDGTDGERQIAWVQAAFDAA